MEAPLDLFPTVTRQDLISKREKEKEELNKQKALLDRVGFSYDQFSNVEIKQIVVVLLPRFASIKKYFAPLEIGIKEQFYN